MNFKVDTRHIKPKIWNIAVLSAIVAAMVGGLIYQGGESNSLPICLVFDGYFVLVLIFLAAAFFKQLQYNPYSYNTIYYVGFFLFVVYQLVTHIFLTVNMVRYPDVYRGNEIIHLLLGSAGNYLLLTFPFIVVFSAGLCASNISLIRHEGKRFVNILGIILSFLMLGGALVLFQFNYYAAGSVHEVLVHDLIGNFGSVVYLYFECMLIGSIVAGILAALYEPDPDKDFIIILGCGINKDGTPTPLLRGRADRALGFYKKQKQETGKDVIFITSGGQGRDEVIPESTSMKRYLISQGIPEDRIIEENLSEDTFENMKFSKEKIWAVNPSGKIAFATTNYHVFRSGLCARRVKMRAVGMGAKTRWYFWPNAAVREFVGLLTEHRGKQILIFSGMIIIYITLTFLAYR